MDNQNQGAQNHIKESLGLKAKYVLLPISIFLVSYKLDLKIMLLPGRSHKLSNISGFVCKSMTYWLRLKLACCW